jgi:hypothetical protein
VACVPIERVSNEYTKEVWELAARDLQGANDDQSVTRRRGAVRLQGCVHAAPEESVDLLQGRHRPLSIGDAVNIAVCVARERVGMCDDVWQASAEGGGVHERWASQRSAPNLRGNGELKLGWED